VGEKKYPQSLVVSENRASIQILASLLVKKEEIQARPAKPATRSPAVIVCRLKPDGAVSGTLQYRGIVKAGFLAEHDHTRS